jgi:hypothetical protein
MARCKLNTSCPCSNTSREMHLFLERDLLLGCRMRRVKCRASMLSQAKDGLPTSLTAALKGRSSIDVMLQDPKT